MDNFLSTGGGGGGEGGFPARNIRQPFNEPMLGDRGAAPPSFSNANGILSRPAPPTLQREDPFVTGQGSGSIPHNRGHGPTSQSQAQPSHDVFMVREASRSNLISSTGGPGAGNSDRLPFVGASADPLNLGGGGEQSGGSHPTKASRHSRSDRGDRGDREKESKLVLPKMLKIAVVGDSTSGKTGICNAFTSEGYSFSRNYHMTTGVSIYAKSIKLPANKVGGGEGRDSIQSGGGSSTEDGPMLEPRINLVLADSAGKPLYRELLPQYWEQLDGFALVIDLTSSTALDSASSWLSLAKDCVKPTKPRHSSEEAGGGDHGGGSNKSKRAGMDHHPSSILGVLIGSKSDLKEQRVISPKAAQDFASQQGLQYFECSAKENSGMEEPFFYLAHQWATTGTTTSSTSGSFDKENNMEESPAGGIFPKSASRKSVFASRQGSSEAL